jgi:DNA gyrase subunit B
MDAEQLLETTMDPKARKMIRITIEDAADAEKAFSELMGDEVAPRREYITQNAKFVKNLDI